MIGRSITALLSLGAVWAAGLSCSSRIEPEFDVEPTLANREEITEAMRAVGRRSRSLRIRSAVGKPDRRLRLYEIE